MGSVLIVAKGQQSAGVNWEALIALVAALIAIGALVIEGRRLRRQLSIENMWRLIDQWDGPEGRARRSEAARQLLAHYPTTRHDVPHALIDVLDTCELLGYLVRSKTFR
jgi:hypothetical protein